MKLLLRLSVPCAVLCLTGCFTLSSADVRRTGEEHVHVANHGWYLFNLVPLVCGNASHDPFLPSVFFRNDVTMDKVQRRFMEYAAFRRREPKDMTYHNYDTVMFKVPGLSFPLPLPYILTYREIQLSGVLQ